MKVLVVDDSASMRMIVKRTLKQAGYEALDFSDAADGLEGLKQLDEVKPDLVLCDWNMPNMNGIDFLRQARKDGNLVKFGFITTESTTEMRQAAREAGAQFLVAKPFNAETFKKTFRRVIGDPG